VARPLAARSTFRSVGSLTTDLRSDAEGSVGFTRPASHGRSR
jgi:hypothetical protein